MRRGWPILAALLLFSLTLCIYEPWVNRGFDIADFSEFQPILDQHDTVLERYRALDDYYAAHGRWNSLSYAFLSLKWSLIGPDPVAWQWLRFAQMTGIGGLVILVLRALGLQTPAAFASAAIVAFSGAAANSYIRMTLGEPLAVLVFLGATLLGVGYQRTPAWRVSAPVIALLLGGIVAAKEVLVVLVPFVLLIALAWNGATWEIPARSRRNAHLLLWSLGAVAAASIMVILAYLGKDPDGFVSEYGAAPGGIIQFAALASYMAAPVHRATPTPLFMLLYPGNLILLVIIVAGGALWWRTRTRSDWVPILACVALPLLGGIIYAPWPTIGEFYALPFVLGTAILVALSMDYTAKRDRRAGAAAGMLAVVGIAYCAAAADANAKARFAQRLIHGRAVDLIVEASEGDTVVVETRSGSGTWRDLAATLRRAAQNKAKGGVAIVAARPCEQAGRDRADVLVLTFPADCSGRPSSESVASGYRFFDWTSLRVVSDSASFGLRRAAPPPGI